MIPNAIVIAFKGLPTSNNRIWRSNGKGFLFRTKAYNDFQKTIETLFKLVETKLPEDWKFVSVKLILSPNTRRDVDVDNRFKALNDTLTRCGFWSDDKIVAEVAARITTPIKYGRTVVIIEPREVKYEPPLGVKDYAVNRNRLVYDFTKKNPKPEDVWSGTTEPPGTAKEP